MKGRERESEEMQLYNPNSLGRFPVVSLHPFPLGVHLRWPACICYLHFLLLDRALEFRLCPEWHPVLWLGKEGIAMGNTDNGSSFLVPFV